MHLNLCVAFLSILKIISSQDIILIEKEHKQDVINIINELNHRLNIEWNLIFMPEEQPDVDIVLKSLIIPAVVLTKSSEIGINLLHSHQLMSVVFLNESTLERSYQIVERQLDLLKFRPILWITQKAKEGEEDLLNFAKRNWFSGFTRALFFTQQGLYTYDPLPVISIQPIWNIQDYVQKREIADFKKYPLNIIGRDRAPFCFRFQDRWGNVIDTGLFYKILNIFIQRYNFQEIQNGFLNMEALPELKNLNERFANNIMDIVASPIYGFDFNNTIRSKTNWNTRIYVLAPYPPPLSKMAYLHYPFTFSTKISMFLLLFVYAAALTFIYARSDSLNKIEFSKSFLIVLVSFMFQNHFNLSMKTARQKIVFSLLFLNGFIITNLYLAKLYSIMVKNIYGAKIEKLDDLNETSLDILMLQTAYDGLNYYSFTNRNVLRKAKIVEENYLEKAYFDMNNTYLLLSADEMTKFLFFQQKFLKNPRMYKVKEDVIVQPNFFTIRKNLPYVQLFNRYLTYVRESGIFDKLVYESYYDGIISGKIRFFTDDEEDLFLNWESFYAISTYFIYGIALSLVVFTVELLHHKYAKKRFM